MNNEEKLLRETKYFAIHGLHINWIYKIVIGVINFNAVFKPSILTEYLKLSSIKIKEEYDKQKKNGVFRINNSKEEIEYVRKSCNNRKKLCRKNKKEVKQINYKNGSNSKIIKTQQAAQVLEEKANVQSSLFKQNSEDKEISPSLNIKLSST
jgi:hypothetical protein